MPGRFKQVMLPEERLRSGLNGIQGMHREEPVALICAGPEALEKRLGVVFQDSHDDLDYVKVAALWLNSGQRVSLLRHVRSPSPGTELYVSAEEAQRPDALDQILESVGLTRSDLSWVRPGVG